MAESTSSPLLTPPENHGPDPSHLPRYGKKESDCWWARKRLIAEPTNPRTAIEFLVTIGATYLRARLALLDMAKRKRRRFHTLIPLPIKLSGGALSLDIDIFQALEHRFIRDNVELNVFGIDSAPIRERMKGDIDSTGESLRQLDQDIRNLLTAGLQEIIIYPEQSLDFNNLRTQFRELNEQVIAICNNLSNKAQHCISTGSDP